MKIQQPIHSHVYTVLQNTIVCDFLAHEKFFSTPDRCYRTPCMHSHYATQQTKNLTFTKAQHYKQQTRCTHITQHNNKTTKKLQRHCIINTIINKQFNDIHIHAKALHNKTINDPQVYTHMFKIQHCTTGCDQELHHTC